METSQLVIIRGAWYLLVSTRRRMIAMVPWANRNRNCGPWVHPLNLIMCIFVFVAIPVIELIKRTRSELIDRLGFIQIGIWWSYYTLLRVGLPLWNLAGAVVLGTGMSRRPTSRGRERLCA